MSQQSQATQTTVFRSNPELMEYLNNVIQDAQSSGAIVHVITILPPHIERVDDSGLVTIEGCNPKAQTCPK
jgi:hypothetical protein